MKIVAEDAGALRFIPSVQARSPWTPGRLKSSDLGPLMQTVGILVNELYPHGAKKLQDRLEDALSGYANAFVVRDPHSELPIALASETKKGSSGIKVSTFWVHPLARGRGIGKLLLRHRIEDWQQTAVPTATVTVREERARQLERLFLPFGFMRSAVVIDRYGENRSEVILRWKLDTSLDVSSLLAA